MHRVHCTLKSLYLLVTPQFDTLDKCSIDSNRHDRICKCKAKNTALQILLLLVVVLIIVLRESTKDRTIECV